jgi:hypothetical protein
MKLKIFKVVIVIVMLVLLLNTALAAVRTYRVQETDFVKIIPKGFDPDNDDITYNYSTPLDQKGEWQTDYGDAGEYNVFVTASDGKLESSEEIRIVVLDRNEPPFLKEKKIVVKEAQEVNLKKIVADPENDALEFNFNHPFNKQGIWQTGYEDEGTYIIEFQVTDGEFEKKFRVEVIITHTNQAPSIIDIFSSEKNIKIKEGEMLDFFVKAKDNDNDEIFFTWTLNDKEISNKESGDYPFSFDSQGQHVLELVLSDENKKTSEKWIVDVENVNRKPVFELLPLDVFEGDKVKIDVPLTDLDNDILTYTFEKPLNNKGEWQTNFEDSGKYKLEIAAFDGELNYKKEIEINVKNVDRAPTLNLPEEKYFAEGKSNILYINSSDPDGDELEISFENFPDNAIFDKNSQELKWKPGYDFIKRKEGFFSEILNTLRLEHKFLNTRSFPITVTSCGSVLCSKKVIKFIVNNVNREPVFEKIGNITILETETLKLNISAIDPDGDIVRYFFSEPLNKRDGKWVTNYDNAGKYTFEVTATDGYLEKTKSFDVTVKNKNRPLELSLNKDIVIVNEGEEFTLFAHATDPDNDSVSITLEELPNGAEFRDGTFVWSPGFDTIENKTESSWHSFLNEHAYLNKKFSKEEKLKWLKFVATDGEFEVIKPVKVRVKNMNQGPEIIDYIPAIKKTSLVNEPILFHVAAKDLDQDKLTYRWDFGRLREEAITGTNTVERTFTTPGKKEVKVKVSDGRQTIEQYFLVDVYEEEVYEEIIDVVSQPPLTFKVLVIEG